MSLPFLKYVQRGATAEVADAVHDDPSLLTARDVQGISPLLWSIYATQPLIRDYLLAQLADAGIALDLFESSAVGDEPSLRRALKEAPAAINDFAPDGWTALHLAAAFGTPQAVQTLLEHGAKVDAVSRNPQANQPLHAALALGRDPESIRLLLAAGADPNARQTAGYTGIFSAAAANRRDLCELLIEHGADPSLENDFHQTAAGFARERGHTELAAWLVSLDSAV
jgi:uncharacterized protein